MLTREDPSNQLGEETGEDPITAAASVSPSQEEQDLRAGGFDVKADRERANAVIARLIEAAEAFCAEGRLHVLRGRILGVSTVGSSGHEWRGYFRISSLRIAG
jgi:hypothetical protein